MNRQIHHQLKLRRGRDRRTLCWPRSSRMNAIIVKLFPGSRSLVGLPLRHAPLGRRQRLERGCGCQTRAAATRCSWATTIASAGRSLRKMSSASTGPARTSMVPLRFHRRPLRPALGHARRPGLTNRINYVVLSMDIPYQVASPESEALDGTTSGTFYGFKPDPNPAFSLASARPTSTPAPKASSAPTPPVNAISNSCS